MLEECSQNFVVPAGAGEPQGLKYQRPASAGSQEEVAVVVVEARREPAARSAEALAEFPAQLGSEPLLRLGPGQELEQPWKLAVVLEQEQVLGPEQRLGLALRLGLVPEQEHEREPVSVPLQVPAPVSGPEQEQVPEQMPEQVLQGLVQRRSAVPRHCFAGTEP